MPKKLNKCWHILMCGVMVNMTLSLPKEIREEMKKFPEVKWSEVARKAIIQKLQMLSVADEIANKSQLTEKDVREFGRKIKALAAKRFLNENSA